MKTSGIDNQEKHETYRRHTKQTHNIEQIKTYDQHGMLEQFLFLVKHPR